jgi:hypothetical protein
MIGLLPRRLAWRRPFGMDWSRALSGMFLGLVASGGATALALILEIVVFSASGSMSRPGPGDLLTVMVIVPLPIAAYGTALALVPMTAVMALERIARIDLGPICWTMFGLPPSLVVGSMMPGTISGGIAMAAGSVGGLVAWTRRHAAQDDARPSWETVLIACVALTALTVAVCLQMPPLSTSD